MKTLVRVARQKHKQVVVDAAERAALHSPWSRAIASELEAPHCSLTLSHSTKHAPLSRNIRSGREQSTVRAGRVSPSFTIHSAMHNDAFATHVKIIKEADPRLMGLHSHTSPLAAPSPVAVVT